jgi:hypothetical protein
MIYSYGFRPRRSAHDRGARLLQLSRCTRQPRQSSEFSTRGTQTLAACDSTSQSAEPHDLGAPGRFCDPVASCTQDSSSLYPFALRRQTSAVRAVCANERPHGSARVALGNWRPYRNSFADRLLLAVGAVLLRVVAQSQKGILLGHSSVFLPQHQIGETQHTTKQSQDQRGAAESSRRGHAHDPGDSNGKYRAAEWPTLCAFKISKSWRKGWVTLCISAANQERPSSQQAPWLSARTAFTHNFRIPRITVSACRLL